MKKLFTIAICLIFGLSVVAQNPLVVEESEAYYLQKRKNAKTTGMIMLGGGLAMTGAGIATALNGPFGSDHGEGVLLVGGVGIALASIIPFSKAGKYKKEAAAVAVGFQEIMPLSNYGWASSNNVPAIQFKVNLN